MKRILLIAAVLFAAFFTIWFMIDRWNRSEREEITSTEEKEVLGLSSSGGAVSTGGAVEATAQPEAATGSAIVTAELGQRSEKDAKNIISGMVDKVLEESYDPLKSNTTADDLKRSYESVTEKLGNYVGIEGIDEYEENG